MWSRPKQVLGAGSCTFLFRMLLQTELLSHHTPTEAEFGRSGNFGKRKETLIEVAL